MNRHMIHGGPDSMPSASPTGSPTFTRPPATAQASSTIFSTELAVDAAEYVQILLAGIRVLGGHDANCPLAFTRFVWQIRW
jgi:hypothetical protein